MSDNLTIDQRRLGAARTFQFDAESLVYTIRDQTGERTFSVPYQAVDTKNLSKFRLKAPRLARVLFATTLFSFAGLSTLAMAFDKSASPFVTLAGLGVLAAFWLVENLGLLAVSYTLIPMTPAPPGANSNTLSIIDDDRRDQVVDELSKRSRERLRALFGSVNLYADPSGEAARMQWLRERGVISEEEYAEQLGRLRARLNTDHGQPEVRLN